jgi:GNAT superfamily N-acetyltransferase
MEHLGIQFHYQTVDTGASKPRHLLQARRGDEQVGSMMWSNKDVRQITVAPEHQRQGIATALWHEGHRLAAENRAVPQPKHSADRTDSGDAWARSVGGKLPRRVKE